MQTLQILSGILFLVAFLPYIRAIVRGSTRPAKASWIIWGALDTITFAGMFATDALNGQIVAAVIGVWAVIILALKYGLPGWTRIDKLCLIGAALGIILWRLTHDPRVGLLTSLVVTFLGSIPTFVSAWQDPGRENRMAWLLFTLSGVVAVIAIPAWSIQDAAQPFTFLAIDAIVLAVVLFRKPLASAVTA